MGGDRGGIGGEEQDWRVRIQREVGRIGRKNPITGVLAPAQSGTARRNGGSLATCPAPAGILVPILVVEVQSPRHHLATTSPPPRHHLATGTTGEVWRVAEGGQRMAWWMDDGLRVFCQGYLS